MTAEGRWVNLGGNLGLVTWMPREQRLWSGNDMPLALVRLEGIKEAESQLVKQLLYGNRKGPRFYLRAACHPSPPPNSAAGEMESGRPRRPYERRDLGI